MRKTLFEFVHGAADLTVGGWHVLHPRGSGHGVE